MIQRDRADTVQECYYALLCLHVPTSVPLPSSSCLTHTHTDPHTDPHTHTTPLCRAGSTASRTHLPHGLQAKESNSKIHNLIIPASCYSQINLQLPVFFFFPVTTVYVTVGPISLQEF